MSWRGRGTYGPWPGRGPFSNLPPWQRPGWLYGPGACWWLYGSRYTPFYQQQDLPSLPEQIEELEIYKKDIEEELNKINKEIERLKKETAKKAP